MVKYYQKKENDCLTAVLATLLQIDVASIPFFFGMDSPNEEYKSWLLEKHNICVISIDYDKKKPSVPGVSLPKYYCIGTLKHDIKTYSHAVILRCTSLDGETAIEIFHDPLGDKTCYDITDLVGIEYLVNFKISDLSGYGNDV